MVPPRSESRNRDRPYALSTFAEWKETSEYEYWTATYQYDYTFENVTRQFLSEKVAKLVSPAFGEGRWHISIGTIAKAEGYLGVFLGAAQDVELQTSKQWVRRCVKCTASLGTPTDRERFGTSRNISGGYTFCSTLESRRGQAKYVKLSELVGDEGYRSEGALSVSVELEERRRSLRPSPFGDIGRFASTIRQYSHLFDNPALADVVFVFPRPRGIGRGPKTIYAQKWMLRSVPYFQTMFDSGFMESGETQSQDGDDADEMVFHATPTRKSPLASPMSDGSRALSHSPASDSSYLEDSDLEFDDAEDLHAVESAAGELSLDSQPRLPGERPAKKRRYSQAMPGEDLPAPRVGIQKITIQGTAYTTYRALLQYIYTNSIMFAPLRSTYLIHRTRVDSKGRKPTERRSQYSRDNGLKYSLVCEASELEPTSPKSIYALADMLQIRELREEALNQYIRCLTADNICSELQSPFASRHETIANLAFGFLRQNWKLINSTAGWRAMLEDGFMTLSPSLRADLIRFVSTLEVPHEEPVQSAE